MTSFRCYDNSDVIATLIMTIFHLYLIQLWWQFFQMFVHGGVVYAQCWQVLTVPKLYRDTFICQYGLCCCIVWRSFLFVWFVKIWATCKNFLGKLFTPPPGRKLPVPLCAFSPVPAFFATHDLCATLSWSLEEARKQINNLCSTLNYFMSYFNLSKQIISWHFCFCWTGSW